MKKNVLAENPLDMMFSRPRKEAAELPEPVSKVTPSVVVSIDANGSRATPHILPVERPNETVPQIPGAAPSLVQPVGAAEETVGSTGSGAGLNRIGTLHKPYVRQKDGVETRQASVTLPVDMLRKVGHCAVDNRMKTSEVIRAALEEYLERRGY